MKVSVGLSWQEPSPSSARQKMRWASNGFCCMATNTGNSLDSANTFLLGLCLPNEHERKTVKKSSLKPPYKMDKNLLKVRAFGSVRSNSCQASSLISDCCSGGSCFCHCFKVRTRLFACFS